MKRKAKEQPEGQPPTKKVKLNPPQPTVEQESSLDYIQKEDIAIDPYQEIGSPKMKKKKEHIEQVPCQGLVRSKESKPGDDKLVKCTNTVSKDKVLVCGICFGETKQFCYHHKRKIYGWYKPQCCKNCKNFMGCVGCLKSSIICKKCGGRLCQSCGKTSDEGFHRCFVGREIEKCFSESRENYYESFDEKVKMESEIRLLSWGGHISRKTKKKLRNIPNLEAKCDERKEIYKYYSFLKVAKDNRNPKLMNEIVSQANGEPENVVQFHWKPFNITRRLQ